VSPADVLAWQRQLQAASLTLAARAALRALSAKEREALMGWLAGGAP
jgi:hypothetical protein